MAQSVNAPEFSLVGSDDHAAERDGLRSDKQIVTPYRSTRLLKARSDQSVGGVGRGLEWQDIQRSKHGLKLGRKPRLSLLGRTVT